MKICSPAKVNFFLHVRGKRPDGYDELFSLMCRIHLFDEISLQIGGTHKGVVEIYCSHPKVPADATNLAHRAACLFQSQLHTAQGIKIHLKKHPFSREQLMEMGLTLGADVPFFIFKRPAIATGIGEKLAAFDGVLPYHILLLNHGFNVSTAETYQNLNFGLTNDQKKPTNNDLKLTRFDPAHHLSNDLERVTVTKYPEIGLAKEKLLELGAIGALMSGSGPTVFGLFDSAETATSARQHLMMDTDRDTQLFLADPILEPDPI